MAQPQVNVRSHVGAQSLGVCTLGSLTHYVTDWKLSLRGLRGTKTANSFPAAVMQHKAEGYELAEFYCLLGLTPAADSFSVTLASVPFA